MKIYTIVFILLASNVFAQFNLKQQMKSEEEADLPKREIPQIPGLERGLAVDRKIDEQEYIVGPGDQFLINIRGTAISSVFKLSVSVEGNLYIPDIGILYVSGFRLIEAKKSISAKINQLYKSGNTVDVTLIALREIRVSLAGAIGKPGMYQLNSANRVSDLIDRGRSEEDEISLRSIQLIRTASNHFDTLDVDLFKFYRLGDYEFNPYLIEGDVVNVFPIQKEINRINVYGAIKEISDFEFRSGDRLKDAINLSYGFTDDADIEHIELTRFIDNKKTSVKKLSFRTHARLLLHSDDIIFVPFFPEYHKKHKVTISGEVLYPGVYTIKEDSCKVSDIIEKAGNLAPKADLVNAYLIRRSKEDVIDIELERLKSMIASGSKLTDEEQEYFKLRSRQRLGTVSLNLPELLQNKNRKSNILLKDGDYLFIPRITKTVEIVGAVMNPGILDYASNQNYKEYISKAGGFGNRARAGRVIIIKNKTGQWLNASTSIPIEEGDKIFVPEKPVRDYWVITKDILTAVTQVVAIYSIVKTATR